MFSNIGVVGAGAMGTAISQTICENTQNVLLYARREEVAISINKTHINKDYFPNIRLEDNIIAVNDLNKLKLEHKSCSKNASILQSKLNVLNNDIDFEMKRKVMFSSVQEKKTMTTIGDGNKRNSYGKRIRNILLQNTDNKYDFHFG